MSPALVAFIVGLFIGTICGITIIAILVVGRRDDEEEAARARRISRLQQRGGRP